MLIRPLIMLSNQLSHIFSARMPNQRIVTLFFFVILSIVFDRSCSSDVSQSETSRYYNRKASVALRKAEHLVHLLKSAFVCHELNKSNKKKCPKRQPERLAKAVKQLEFLARRERLKLNLPKLPYNTTIIEPLVGPVQGTILDMHGYTGSGAFMMQYSILPAIRCGALPGVRFVVPTAWLRPDPLTKELVNAWYEFPESVTLSDFWTRIESIAFPRDQIFAAAGNISMTLDTMSSVMGISRDRAGVLGTSQGGSMAITVHLRHNVKAAVSFVGIIVDQDAYPNEMTSLSAKNKILMINSRDDETVPYSIVESTYSKLVSLGRKVKLTEISGTHISMTQKRRTEYANAYNFIRKEIGVNTINPKEWKRGNCIDVDPVFWELK